MLLVERSNDIEVLVENKTDGKNVFIEGVFMQSEVRNRNGRIYPKSILEQAVDNYINEYVLTRRALGELNHPEDRAQVDPAEAVILIESLSWQGNDVIGKAKILNTPRGIIVKNLLEDGWGGGVSSRATGSVTRSNGVATVNNDLRLFAVDVVDGPSAPDAFVKTLYESNQELNKYLVEYINSLKIKGE